MIEKKNFAEQEGKIIREAAEACLALFKEYSITEMELMEPINADLEGQVQSIRAVKVDDPESELNFNWFSLRGEYDDWFSPGDGYMDFDWVGLYESICDTINHFLENDIPVSEWDSRESFDE